MTEVLGSGFTIGVDQRMQPSGGDFSRPDRDSAAARFSA